MMTIGECPKCVAYARKDPAALLSRLAAATKGTKKTVGEMFVEHMSFHHELGHPDTVRDAVNALTSKGRKVNDCSECTAHVLDEGDDLMVAVHRGSAVFGVPPEQIFTSYLKVYHNREHPIGATSK